MCPPIGAGALGLQCREDDTARIEAVTPLGDPQAWREITAERMLLHITVEPTGRSCWTSKSQQPGSGTSSTWARLHGPANSLPRSARIAADPDAAPRHEM
jgi:hypothetical protein